MTAMNDDEPTDEDYLIAVRKAREESVRFFAACNRPERELWVANEFLTNLGVDFTQDEITHVTDDPPDIRFRGAEFEIKEILDPDRRRHADFKAALEKANAATSPCDLLEHYTPRDITYDEIYAHVEANVANLTVKYAPGARARLDLLFYVNLEDVHGYIGTPLPSPDQLRKHGFRSVSFVMGLFSGVLMATESAPDFLKNRTPRISRRQTNSE
jgi:hypothetical protein